MFFTLSKKKVLIVAALAVTTLAAGYKISAAADNAGDKSDATPEIGQPKIYSDAEIAAMPIADLKLLSMQGSIEQKSPLAFYYLGMKQKNANDNLSAVTAFRELSEKYQGHYLAPKALLELADIYHNANEQSNEVNILKKLTDEYPKYQEGVSGYYRLVNLYKENKRFDELRQTLDTMETVFENDKNLIPALFLSANQYLKNYNSKMALSKFDKILANKDVTLFQKSQALLGKAAAFEYNGQPKEAENIYDEITKLQGVEKSIIDSAEKSKKLLEKAPKEALVKIEAPALNDKKIPSTSETEIKKEASPAKITEGNDGVRTTGEVTAPKIRIND